MPSVNSGNQYLRLVRELGGVLEGFLPLYGSRYSRKDYTLHQHVIMLVLRSRERKPYREFVEWLEVSDRVKHVLDIQKVPHYTILQKVADRLPPGLLEKMMNFIGKLLVKKDYTAGVDSTGFSLDYSSRYYCKRVKRKQESRNYLKTSLAGDMNSQMILSARLRLKQRNDNIDFKPLLRKIHDTKPSIVVGDKGYDSKDNLEFVKQELNATPIIPIRNTYRPLEKTKSELRRELRQHLPLKKYHQRSKIETIISVIKRCYGNTIHSHNHRTKKNELYFKLIAYNLRRLTKLIETLLQRVSTKPQMDCIYSTYGSWAYN